MNRYGNIDKELDEWRDKERESERERERERERESYLILTIELIAVFVVCR